MKSAKNGRLFLCLRSKNMKENTENVDLTDDVADYFLARAIEHYANPQNKGEVLMFFRRCEKKCLKGWKKIMINSHPYDFNQRLSECTDISKRKIERITLKE